MPRGVSAPPGLDLFGAAVFHPFMNNFRPRRFLFLLLLVFVTALAACSGKPENGIIGKWKGGKSGEREAIVTFTKDGRMIDEEGGKSETRDYTLSISNTITLKVETNMTLEFDIHFNSPDELVLTPRVMNGITAPAGMIEPVKFTRVK